MLANLSQFESIQNAANRALGFQTEVTVFNDEENRRAIRETLPRIAALSQRADQLAEREDDESKKHRDFQEQDL